jgi:pyruvate kinase
MRTKLSCTLGPATDSDDIMSALLRAGMSVARLNLSHGTHEDHARRAEAVRRLAADLGAHLAVMADLQGPKFRLGALPDEGLAVAAGSTIVLDGDALATPLPGARLPFPHPEVITACLPGQRLLIDDGSLELRVTGREGAGALTCEVVTAGTLSSRKGVSVPGLRLAMSAITEKDRADVAFACGLGVDALALSFVQRGADVDELRRLARSHGADPLLVAKIERPQALEDLAAIVAASDVLMVARGDLGVECPIEDVPLHQKRIIRAGLAAGVPVMTATQVLQSMVHSPVPTRAEASDIANAVFDGTDSIMLSAETAVGDHPVATVEALARIARRAEDDAMSRSSFFADDAFLAADGMPTPDRATAAITRAAVRVASEVGARVIACTTSSGRTPRMVARHRPDQIVLALTPSERAHRLAAFTWGVRSVLGPLPERTQQVFDHAASTAVSLGLAQPAEPIVITASFPLDQGTGHTNLIEVHSVPSARRSP